MNSQTSAASSAKVTKGAKHPHAGLVAAMTAAPKKPTFLSSNSDADAADGQNLDSPSAIGRAVRNMLYEMDESAIFLDPPEVFDDAILGITEGDLGPVRVIYDSDRCVARMAKHHGWDWDEAMEFFSFNTLGTHIEGYPVFLAKPMDMPPAEFSEQRDD